MNATYPKPHRRFVFFLGAIATVFLFAAQAAEARTYHRTVTIYDYYGLQGKDARGNKIYGASVVHGNDYYYVELLTPMPCLLDHRMEKAYVTINDNPSAPWMNVEFDGHTARVKKVTKVEDQQPTYDDFYHRTSSREHNHRHDKKEDKPWLPFKWW